MNKGFGLIDTIIGLFLLGLIVVLILPIFTSVYNQYSKINSKTEMIYLGESIYERLCSKDEYSKELIDSLTHNDEVIFDDVSVEYLQKYESRIIKIEESEIFLKINIIINPKSNGGNISDVEFEASILK